MSAGDVRRAVIGAESSDGAAINVEIVLDGHGRAGVATGDAFLDHLLGLAARHADFDLTVTVGAASAAAAGESDVEAVALAVGHALRAALGDRQTVRRFGWATLPVAEALALVALDVSSGPFLAYDIDLSGVRIEAFDADRAGRFLRALVDAAGITLHVRLLSGSDPHNVVDAVFEGLGEALRTACGVVS
jgi:imidazoleglycerol-phosphate dehydratase